jgi:hypothetical protein
MMVGMCGWVDMCYIVWMHAVGQLRTYVHIGI